MKLDRTLRRRRPGVLPLAAFAAALALTAAACGGDDEPAGGGGGEASGGGGTAVIGVAAPLSGEAAIFGDPVDKTVRAAVKEVNDLGGINGTMLEVVTEDEKFNPEDGVRVVNKLVNTDDAQAIIGITSGTLMATLDYAKQNEVMIISPYAGIVEYEGKGGDFTFRTVGPDSLDGMSIATFLYDQGIRKIALMHENTDSAESTSRWLGQFFQGFGGEVVDTVTFNAGQGSYLAEVRRVWENEPELVFLASTAEPAVPILREWFRLGIGGKWSFIIELSNDEFAAEAGPEVVEGSYGQITAAATDSPAFQHMMESLEATYPGKGEEIGNAPAAAQDYDAMVVTALAMLAGGEATGTAVNENYQEVANPPGTVVYSIEEGKKELEAGNDIDYQGASGPVDFNESGTAAPDYAILQVTDGHFDVVEQYPSLDLFERLAEVGE
jgi:ABC-type branched-subunit amino acid transport system substrate-binding protein